MGNKNWKRKFIAIYTGQFFSLLSSAAVQFSIIWWLTDTTGGSPLVLTLAGLAGFLPQALVGPFAGTITDRYSRKFMMILADMTVALGSLLLFITMYFNEPSIPLVIVILVYVLLQLHFICRQCKHLYLYLHLKSILQR